MGRMLVKSSVGWISGLPYVRLTSGWARVKKGYRKTSSTVWTQFLTVDSTPPAVPVVTAFERSGTKLKVTVRAPSDADVSFLRVKVAKRISANVDTDADYVSTPDGTDAAWSDWTVAPGQTRTKYFPVTGTLTNGATYYVTVWAQDTSKNWSNPATASVKYTVPAVVMPKTQSVAVSTTDSSTFRRTNNDWTTSDKYPDIGGTQDKIGLFFYGTKLAAQLKNAKDLTRVRIKLQRLNDRGYTGAARFHLLAHTMTGYSNVDLDTGGRIARRDDTTVLTLSRGQTDTFTIPAEWYPDILSGKIKGFAVYSQLSSGTDSIDPYDATFYGVGTTSGRLYLEYTE